MNRNWHVEFLAAAKTFNWEQVHDVATQYVTELNGRPSHHIGDIANILETLRTNLRYEDLELVADAALANDLRTPVVRRQYAQALVDGGQPALALVIFQGVVDDDEADEKTRFDARGGVGRCNKELFLTCTNPERRRTYLRACLDAYLEVFESAKLTYHGINAVAMLARARREHLEPDDSRMRQTAQSVLDLVDGPTDDGWNQVTACEALIALGRHEEAVQRAQAFVATDPGGFYVASFLRQLTQVWQLHTADEPGHTLLPVLRSALLRYSGGQVIVQSRDVNAHRLGQLDRDPRLEAVLGGTRFKNLQWYKNGLLRCRAVARILTIDGDPVGTGFLVAGKELHPNLPCLVLVTNGHVIPEQIRPERAVAVFHGADTPLGQTAPQFRIAHHCWYSPSGYSDLDTTILELTGYPHGVEPLPLAEPLGPKPVPDQRAYVIGHPTGLDQPQFSLQDNLLLEYDHRVMRYRSPTEHGSSGSPVFDDDWGLIGVHHATGTDLPRLHGGGTEPANEGIRFEAILDRLQHRPPHTDQTA